VTSFLIDTNVISEFGRERPASQIINFLESQHLDRLFVADVVLAEVRFGISLLADRARQNHYVSILEDHIRPMFRHRVLRAGEETWLIWKRFERDGRQRRYTFQQPDLVIAALAAEHNMCVVTRDTEPFREAGVSYLNPWLSLA
jgi:toxin FitB